MTAISRGRFYENGPYHFCDHPQPCTCAAPQIGAGEFMKTFPSVLQDLYRSEIVLDESGPGCYWPCEACRAGRDH